MAVKLNEMEKKMTAMQELKWFISDGLDSFDESVKVSEIWEKLNSLLEKEKHQIVAAHFTGQPFSATMLHNAEQYYTEMYQSTEPI